MNSVNIGVASIANVLTALESIGFTVDTTTNIARWSYDTNNNIYFKVEASGSYVVVKIYNSSGTSLWDGASMSQVQMKMTYERIGNSIAFGFIPVTQTGNNIQYLIVEPKDAEDNWLYCNCYFSTGTAINHIIDGNTQNVVTNPTTALYNGSANGVQLCKYYDGTRFVENLYEVPVCASFPQGVRSTTQMTGNNYIEATVGNDTYLILNFSGSATGVKLAIKKTLLTS
jgi:hypothetical protein